MVTWNGLPYTRRCLETLRSNTDFPGYSILVVDNGSTDGTPEYLQTLDWITLLRNSTNLGFARANNQGMEKADQASDIILLNNDVEIHQPSWLQQLQKVAYSSPAIGVVGCRLVHPDGTLQHAGTYMPLDTLWGQQIGGGEKDVNQYNDDRDVEGVVFACVYLKREVLDAVGALDEEYFSYFEDTDFCIRAVERGYRVVCCGSVTIMHHGNITTKINAVRHSDYFLKAQKVFRSKWEHKLRQQRYTREIGWHSAFNLPTGYAISSRELVSALDRKGVHVRYKYAYGPGTALPVPEPEQSESYLIDIIRRRAIRTKGVHVVYAHGDLFRSTPGSYKIGFTMLETDGVPEEWVRQANRMDEIWVPSQFNARSFRTSGVTRPLYVIPLGVDQNYFNPRIVGQGIPGVFTFLSIFEWGERKAPEVLLRAFNEEFRRDEGVILICKSLNTDPGVDVRGQIAGLGLDPNGGRIHFSLNQVVPRSQLGVVYRSADCFVLTTRGEGWGMPVLEAMACGLPVIATNWSGHCDFMNGENAYPLAVEGLVPARAKCPYYAGFHWAEPSHRDLRRLMRHVVENRNEARARGERAAREVRAQWTWDEAARKIIARLDAINEKHGHGGSGTPGRDRRVLSGQ
jgi:hypothetical protein